MGLCQSEEERSQAASTRAIDRTLKRDKEASERVIKLLLLGAGECGKSTVLKQMRILHNNGFTEEELMQQRGVVYNNTIQAMAALLRAMQSYHVQFTDPARELDARTVLEAVKAGIENEPFSPQLAAAIKQLWADDAVVGTYIEKRLECHLHESSKHFFDEVDRISNPSYRPSELDMLLTRIKTTGIVEVAFVIRKVYFRVFDVGGQRSERKKWIHCFEDVNAIIFITAVSEYDEVLFEDESTNRMIESTRLFESICNSRWFINTAIILFLNKKDLFAEKIQHTNITTAFPNYKGPQTYADAIAYITTRFEALNANPKKTVFVHQTCATDTDQVHKILDSVITMIIQQNLHKSGLY